MLREYWLESSAWLCLWGPLLLVGVIFVGFCFAWRRKIRAATDRKIVVRVDTFREPISAALTVAGFVVPLLCGAIGYFALGVNVAPPKLIPLLGSALLLIFSVLVGLWNLFSLTAAKGENLEMTESHSGGFVAQFVVQLALMFEGFAIILVYFLWLFQPGAAGGSTTANGVSGREGASYSIDRPLLQVGLKGEDVRAAWGRPDSVSSDGPATLWRYHGPKMEFVITLRDGTVDSVLVQRKEK